MKKIVVVLMVVASLSWEIRAQVTPDQIIEAVGKMTPEQVDELQTKLASSYWEPVPEGFFSRFGARLDITYNQFDDESIGALELSNTGLDLEDAGGAEIALLWQVLAPEFRIGLKFGGSTVSDSKSSEAGYSRIDLNDGYWAFIVNYQLIREEKFLLWLEGGAGFGWMSMETLNTPSGEASTLREYDGDYGMGDLRLGASWRFNPILSLHASAGYRFAGEVDFEEADRETLISVDPSGLVASIGLGVSF
jgi:hypothetical protein